VTFGEEAYNVVVETYDCVYPQVQEAAGMLIGSLIHKGDLSNAERFAQQTYENLRDRKNGIDQEGEVVAKGSYNLANVSYQQDGGGLLKALKAEGLARESLRIRSLIHGNTDERIGACCIRASEIQYIIITITSQQFIYICIHIYVYIYTYIYIYMYI
jgi:hypothetical protein